MLKYLIVIFGWGALQCSRALYAASPNSDTAHASYIDDPASLISSEVSWAASTQAELETFQRASGIKILIQFHLKSPPADIDKQPGAYMRALATQLGVIRDGVLVVYFADEPDWRVWVGNDLTPRFVGRAGSAQEFTEDGSMHQAKEAFLTAAMGKADAAFAARPKSAPADPHRMQATHLTLQAGSLIDGLRAKLGPP